MIYGPLSLVLVVRTRSKTGAETDVAQVLFPIVTIPQYNYNKREVKGVNES